MTFGLVIIWQSGKSDAAHDSMKAAHQVLYSKPNDRSHQDGESARHDRPFIRGLKRRWIPEGL